MTAPSKPTIDELIARQQQVMAEYTGTDTDAAILATLQQHKQIMEAERPEPVAYGLRSPEGYWAGCWSDKSIAVDLKKRGRGDESVVSLYALDKAGVV